LSTFRRAASRAISFSVCRFCGFQPHAFFDQLHLEPHPREGGLLLELLLLVGDRPGERLRFQLGAADPLGLLAVERRRGGSAWSRATSASVAIRWAAAVLASSASRVRTTASWVSSASAPSLDRSARKGRCSISHTRGELTTAFLDLDRHDAQAQAGVLAVALGDVAQARGELLDDRLLVESTSSMLIVATVSLIAASACSRSWTLTTRIGSTTSLKSSLRYAVLKSWMIHCT
jgi:hypothetical protein